MVVQFDDRFARGRSGIPSTWTADPVTSGSWYLLLNLVLLPPRVTEMVLGLSIPLHFRSMQLMSILQVLRLDRVFKTIELLTTVPLGNY